MVLKFYKFLKNALKSEPGIVIDNNSNYKVFVYIDGKGNYVIIISKTKQ